MQSGQNYNMAQVKDGSTILLYGEESWNYEYFHRHCDDINRKIEAGAMDGVAYRLLDRQRENGANFSVFFRTGCRTFFCPSESPTKQASDALEKNGCQRMSIFGFCAHNHPMIGCHAQSYQQPSFLQKMNALRHADSSRLSHSLRGLLSQRVKES
jgi:hypothetical protein